MLHFYINSRKQLQSNLVSKFKIIMLFSFLPRISPFIDTVGVKCFMEAVKILICNHLWIIYKFKQSSIAKIILGRLYNTEKPTTLSIFNNFNEV
jgi:hypothetical protein